MPKETGPDLENGSPHLEQQTQVRQTLRRRIGRIGLSALLVASGSARIATWLGYTPFQERDRKSTELVPTTPPTREATPELEAAREQAHETAVGLADRIIDLYDEAPEDRREKNPHSPDNTVTYTVYADAPPTDGGVPGSYGMIAQIGKGEDDMPPDPRDVRSVTVFMNEERHSPAAAFDETVPTRFSLELWKADPVPGSDAPTEWTMREAYSPDDREHNFAIYSTASPEASNINGGLSTQRLDLANDRANRVLDMAAAGAPISYIS